MRGHQKQWGFRTLLEVMDTLPNLTAGDGSSHRCLHIKLCEMYQIVHFNCILLHVNYTLLNNEGKLYVDISSLHMMFITNENENNYYSKHNVLY